MEVDGRGSKHRTLALIWHCTQGHLLIQQTSTQHCVLLRGCAVLTHIAHEITHSTAAMDPNADAAVV